MNRFTKTQYEFLAQQINGGKVYHHEEYINTVSFIVQLANSFESSDNKFDRARFYAACGIEAEANNWPRLKTN